MEKKISSELIFDGTIMKVYKDIIEINGMEAVREVVYHNGGVGIVAVEDGEIILAKQFRYPFQKETIEIPAGKLELNEDPYIAAFREFEEETNRRAKEMNFLFNALPTPGYSSEKIALYEAIDFKEVDDSLAADPDENIKVIKMPIEEAYNKVLNGEIDDAKTVIAIMYLKSRNQ